MLAFFALLLAAPQQSPGAVDYVHRSIDWYRAFTPLLGEATDPVDIVFAADVRQDAPAILRLSFEAARALLALDPSSAPAAAAVPARGGLTQALSEATARAQAAQARVARLQAAAGKSSPALEAQLIEARSALELAQAREATLKTFVSFLDQAGSPADAGDQIDELERSVPEARATSGKAVPPVPAVTKPEPTGVLGLIGDLLATMKKLGDLRAAIRQTTDLFETARKIQAPLVAELRQTLKQGDDADAGGGGASAAELRARAKSIQETTVRFKKISAALLPVSKQVVLLQTFKGNLEQWKGAVDQRADGELLRLLLRLGFLAVGIAVLLVASDFWRRATFLYVQDFNRRHQFLLVRRIVVTAAVSLFVVFALVTEAGSLATFAGFITAGLAVALQSVILSIAGYFFLIGKYGLRVGDRVQISGVTGDVVDIGLVRLQLMEVASGLPTGRVVVFTNAFLFQPTANLYKQLPGSNFAWHQLRLTVAAGGDYRVAEKRVMEAVESMYASYKETIDRQHRTMSESLAVRVEAPKPQSQLRFTTDGLEIAVRFPVPLDRAAAIDDQMTRAIVAALESEPRVKLAGQGSPAIEST